MLFNGLQCRELRRFALREHYSQSWIIWNYDSLLEDNDSKCIEWNGSIHFTKTIVFDGNYG